MGESQIDTPCPQAVELERKASMLYQLCSRCHFRAPANKRICGTCGQPLSGVKPLEVKNPAAQDSNGGALSSSRAADNKGKTIIKHSAWRSWFGVPSEGGDKNETRHDDPVLGET